MVGPNSSSGNDPRLKLIQEIRSSNSLMMSEIQKWIRYVDDVVGKLSKKYKNSEILNIVHRRDGSKKFQVLESLKEINSDAMKKIFIDLLESLEKEEKDLAKIFREVEVKPTTVSTGVYTSIVEHNETQYNKFNQLKKVYWNSYFKDLNEVLVAMTDEVEEISKEFVKKFKAFVSLLESPNATIETTYHYFIPIVEMMKEIKDDKANKSDIVSHLNNNDATKFINRYFDAEKTITPRIKRIESVKGMSFDEMEDKQSGKKEYIEEFLVEVLEMLFVDNTDIISRLSDIFQDVERENSHSSGREPRNGKSLNSEEKNKLRNAFRQLSTYIGGAEGFKMPESPEQQDELKKAIALILDLLFGGESGIKKSGWKCSQFSKVCRTITKSYEKQEREKAGNPVEILLKTVKENYSSILSGDDAHVNDFLAKLNNVIELNWFISL